MKKYALWVVLGLAVGGMIVVFAIGNRTPASKSSPADAKNWADNLPGLQTGNQPWSNNLGDLHARLDAIGLPALKAEGEVLHIHQHLDLYIEGQKVEVPALIGIGQGNSFISPIHVHDTSGVIHVESPVQQDFTLGQFFAIWGVDIGSDHIGGYKNTTDKMLHVYINGQLQSGDPREIKLAAHQEFVITYGTDAQLPTPITTSYDFPAGE